MNDNDAGHPKSSRLGAAGWIAIVVLVAFLAWSLWYAIHAWNALAGIDISGMGWFFIVIGILFTVAVGAGLMALMFYSSRHDMDR
ncbi:MAG TPA: hypothetical protein VG889_01595 [Rhizomicrobium sp.]|nr:hypothetical protein [Rhizomicrobium sp.]